MAPRGRHSRRRSYPALCGGAAKESCFAGGRADGGLRPGIELRADPAWPNLPFPLIVQTAPGSLPAAAMFSRLDRRRGVELTGPLSDFAEKRLAISGGIRYNFL